MCLSIYWAFRINFRSADATEDIVMTPSELRVRRVSHRGHLIEWSFNPLWVQLEQTGDPEFGIERLYLVSRGRRVSIGHFLGPDEKASFAKALLAALQTAKRGITYNPSRRFDDFLHANRSRRSNASCQKSGGLDRA